MRSRLRQSSDDRDKRCRVAMKQAKVVTSDTLNISTCRLPSLDLVTVLVGVQGLDTEVTHRCHLVLVGQGHSPCNW